jgi:hypothetical protein
MDFGIRWASDAVWLGETSFPNTGRLAADLRPVGEFSWLKNPLSISLPSILFYYYYYY